MRKHIISHSTKQIEASDQPWMDVEHLARVEITSEDQAYPIEAALLSGKGSGWRAAEAGQQMLQLLFDQPQQVRRVRLPVPGTQIRTHTGVCAVLVSL